MVASLSVSEFIFHENYWDGCYFGEGCLLFFFFIFPKECAITPTFMEIYTVIVIVAAV